MSDGSTSRYPHTCTRRSVLQTIVRGLSDLCKREVGSVLYSYLQLV